jgi:hypothetical protein
MDDEVAVSITHFDVLAVNPASQLQGHVCPSQRHIYGLPSMCRSSTVGVGPLNPYESKAKIYFRLNMKLLM